MHAGNIDVRLTANGQDIAEPVNSPRVEVS